MRSKLRGMFRDSAIRSIGSVGYSITQRTGVEDIAAFIRSVRPVPTGIPLIRLGPNGDGGYLVPDDLSGIDACFSPGVSDVSGFEADCARRGMSVYLADASVDGPALEDDTFTFTKRYIGALTSEEFITMDDWVEASGVATDTDLLLQMDIEGAEYEALLSASEALLKRFRILVVEFHGLDLYWSRPFFNIARRVYDKILATHACVHIHPNNCCGSLKMGSIEIPRIVEMTFHRRDRVTATGAVTGLPHPLDADNTDNPSLSLSEQWFTD